MDAAPLHWRPLGTLLVERGLLTAAELEDALALQEQTGERLGQILVQQGLVSHPALTDTLAEQYGIELGSESGFGTGLRSLIERRHSAGRLQVVAAAAGEEQPVAEPGEAAPEIEPPPMGEERMFELVPQLVEQWARLAAAEAAVAERDATIAALERQVGQAHAALQAHRGELTHAADAGRRALEEKEEAVEALRLQLDEARAAAEQAARERDVELDALRAEAESLRRECDHLAELSAGSKRERDEAQRERVAAEADLGDRLETLEGHLSAAHEERDAERTRGEELAAELVRLAAERDALQASARGAGQLTEEARRELEAAREAASAAEARRDEAEATAERLERQLHELSTEREERVDAAERTAAAAGGQVAELQREHGRAVQAARGAAEEHGGGGLFGSARLKSQAPIARAAATVSPAVAFRIAGFPFL